jgi:hypothetical protein
MSTRQVWVTWNRYVRRWYVRVGVRHGTASLVVTDYRRKRDAVTAGRALAVYVAAELVVGKRNGRIAYRDSYGHDPTHRPG